MVESKKAGDSNAVSTIDPVGPCPYQLHEWPRSLHRGTPTVSLVIGRATSADAPHRADASVTDTNRR